MGIKHYPYFNYFYRVNIFHRAAQKLSSLTSILVRAHKINSKLTYILVCFILCGKKLKYPEETHAKMRKTYKPHEILSLAGFKPGTPAN